MNSPNLYLLIALAPLAGALIAGLFGTGFLGRFVCKKRAHSITICGVLITWFGSGMLLRQRLNRHTFDGPIYTWATIGDATWQIGFLTDNLTALMMVVVTSVSLLVHIYTIGYMAEDPGYQRFFSY